jgi:2-polyprenyl-3-methyl-5-hydroxy-6-metoxy-1,4-benzoquinol methylase
MSHLDYYQYQAKARGVHNLADIRRLAETRSYLYDRVILPWLPAQKAAAIAEVACGHGSFLWWLKANGYSTVTGVDSSPEQIELAREVGVAVSQMDFNGWLGERSEGSLQTIVGIDLIEHVSKDEFMDLLRVSYRVLTPGGRLILRYPNGDSPLVGRNLFNDITHVWTYTSNCLNTLALMHGFSRVQFVDETEAAIRDNRWLKVPLCKLSIAFLRSLFRAATKEVIDYWGPNIWACAEK